MGGLDHNIATMRAQAEIHYTDEPSQPRIILEEEDYTSTLTHIVTRDYFPALHTLRRDAAILDARGRGDISEAVSIRRKFRNEEMQRERDWIDEKQEEENALALRLENENGWEKDMKCSSSNNISRHSAQVRKRPRPLQHESVTGFHARVTSEDNAEFEVNQERERRERENFLSFVYNAHANKDGRLMIENQLQRRNDVMDGIGNSSSSSNTPFMRALCDTPIELSSDLFDVPPSAGLRITDGACNNEAPTTRNGIGRNGLFFQPQHHCSIKNNRPGETPKSTPSSSGRFLALESNDARKGDHEEQESNIAKSDNRLMPPPPSRLPSTSSGVMPHQPSNDKSAKPHPMKSTQPTDHRHQLVEYLPKPSLPDIHPPATRFPFQNESGLLRKDTSSRKNLFLSNCDSIGSSICFHSTDASDTTDLDESPRPLDVERAAYQRARVRENETFLPMTPLIRPGREDEEASGSVSSSVWEPTFDVTDEDNREKVARRAEKRILERSKTYRSAGASKRGKMDQDDESVISSRSRSTSTHHPLDRTASLTPAARSLLEASTYARKSAKKSSSSSGPIHPSRIFSSSVAVSGTNAGSRDSFGSSLRMSYTPNRTKWSGSGENGGKQSTSSLRLAAGGATPR